MKNPRLVDLTGKKFIKWTVIRKEGNTSSGAALWICVCDCGNSSIVIGGDLRSGKSTQCKSCSMRDKATTHGFSGTRLFRIYKGMKNRCTNKRSPQYENYGARGIDVCQEWSRDFLAFRSWSLENGYDESLTIDRIDNDKGYCPENCRWATKQTQSENRRFVAIAPDGRLWWHIAQANGISQAAYRSRINYGWPIEKAATIPQGEALDADWRDKRERGDDGRYK